MKRPRNLKESQRHLTKQFRIKFVSLYLLLTLLIDKKINSEPKKKSLRVFEGLHKNIAEQAEYDDSDT